MSDEKVAQPASDTQHQDAYHFFRDHETSGAWGVRATATGRVVAVGLDKTESMIVALFLSGRFLEADAAWREFKKTYRADEVAV